MTIYTEESYGRFCGRKIYQRNFEDNTEPNQNSIMSLKYKHGQVSELNNICKQSTQNIIQFT
jgi:hypothetical protein